MTRTLWLQAFGRCEGLERIPMTGMSPEERREHVRALSAADSEYVRLSAVVGMLVTEVRVD